MGDVRIDVPESVVAELTNSIRHTASMRHLSPVHLPHTGTIHRLLEELQSLIFPGFHGSRALNDANLDEHVSLMTRRLGDDLSIQIRSSLRYMDELGGRGEADEDDRARELTLRFISRLAEIRRLISLDVIAAHRGDPAARHTDEIIFCYPGMAALMVHRVAHELYRLDVPLLPRVMSEHAHSTTGIDIHAGATIGESFFVDHGTGVVIGETTVIGHDCTLYQGVTLGAKNFPTDADGSIIRGLKRHPTLGNRVTVYASATILGGDTVVGDDCVIGGGVFITRSVAAGHVVRAGRPETTQRPAAGSGLFESGGSGI